MNQHLQSDLFWGGEGGTFSFYSLACLATNNLYEPAHVGTEVIFIE